ncbi:hypothetical protein ACHAXR_008714 [Thalassiosira sp. AJA248-18]
MSEFHPLSPSVGPQSDYTISSSDRMDDVSLSSRHTNNNAPFSSGASVTSKFSRSSRKSMKNSDLGVPLTTSLSLEERDENGGGDWTGGNSSINNNGTTASATTTKSYISEDDPFYMFRTDLVQKLSLVDDELNRYLTVVRTTDTSVNTHAVKETKKQLKRQIKHAESTLSDLETTVRVVERQREKFPHINDGEIMERRGFVDDGKDRIAGAKGMMQSDELKQKFLRDERALIERRKGGKGGVSAAPSYTDGANNGSTTKDGAKNNQHGYSNARDVEEGNSTTDPERSETLLMMQQQDETLEDLDMAVTRVGYMAETIHEEIDTQNVMLKSLEEDLADAEEQLGVVMGKLAKLLKTKSKCQIGLIVILSLIVLVLFFLVIYT